MKLFQIIFIIAFLIIANRNTDELALVTIYKQVFNKEIIKTPSQNTINKKENKNLKTINA